MNDDFSINLDQVPRLVDYLIEAGVGGLYVCGSTGEWASLTLDERRSVAESFVAAARRRIPVIVHVGHNCLRDARELAKHAAQIDADGIAAVPPSYFPTKSIDTLVDSMSEIAKGIDLPFFYYHLPSQTHVDIDMVEFFRRAEDRIPTLAGAKYSAPSVYELQRIIDSFRGKYLMLFGKDEMLLSGLVVGAPSAVGSTYNLAAPLYRKIVAAYSQGRIDEARGLQSIAARMVAILDRHGGIPAIKEAMKFVGIDCGPCRLPLATLEASESAAMKKEFEGLGFFGWTI